MIQLRSSGKYIVALFVALWISSSAVALAPAHSAVDPRPRPDEWWQQRQAAVHERAKAGNIDLVFIGDSITQGWEDGGKEAWQKHYGPRKALNLGFSGDRTQHVLWRLDNGNVDGIQPKLVVIMIGTNNSNGNDNTAEEIADGTKAIVEKLRAKLPQTKVLLLAIFPRGESPNPQREKNARASQLASAAADGKSVFYLDIGPKFLADEGKLPKDLMPDFLHLSPAGYQIWADGIEEQVAKLMQ